MKNQAESENKVELATFKQNIYIKRFLGLDVFQIGLDIKETADLIGEMKKDPKFVCDYLLQKGAHITDQKKFDKMINVKFENKQNEISDFYTIKEISKKCSVCVSTVFRWIQDGHLKAHKKDSKWIVDKNVFGEFEKKKFGVKEMKNNDVIAAKKTGISQKVLVHITQNKHLYSSDFSINEVHKNIGIENYTFEQINSALLNLSINKKTKDAWLEKVNGRRGVFRTKFFGNSTVEKPVSFSVITKTIKNINEELYLPNEIIENFVENCSDKFTIMDICKRYPKAKRNSIAKALQKGHKLIKKLNRGIYISLNEKQIKNDNDEKKINTMDDKYEANKFEIKSAIKTLKSMDKNITVQHAMSILAEKICELI